MEYVLFFVVLGVFLIFPWLAKRHIQKRDKEYQDFLKDLMEKRGTPKH